MNDVRNICPHVALLLNGMAIVCSGARQRLTTDIVAEDLGLEVLTEVGWICGPLCDFVVYFSPNPKIYLEAVEKYLESGEPIALTYQDLWVTLGMEHDTWDR
jgi:hypothetical protein